MSSRVGAGVVFGETRGVVEYFFEGRVASLFCDVAVSRVWGLWMDFIGPAIRADGCFCVVGVCGRDIGSAFGGARLRC